MTLRNLKFPLLIVLIFALGRCGSLRIDAPVPYAQSAEIKKVALMAVYVSPFQQPKTPVADASTFNKKTDALAEELNQLLVDKANQFAQSLAKGIEMQLGVEVLTGKALESTRGYDRFKRDEEKEPLQIAGTSKFNTIYVAQGGFNVFDFDNGALQEFIDESPRLRSVARKQARNLESSAVAFSHTRVVLDQVSPLGKKAAARLYTDIYIYDDKGKLIGHGSGETKSINITGDDLAQYKLVLDQYPELQNKVLAAMIVTEEAEEED
jgi:hypothetical protein